MSGYLVSPPLDSFAPEPTNSTRSFLGPEQAVRSGSETRSPTEVPLSTHSGDSAPTPFFPNIPRYQIIESLGHGGMGHVFLAHDTQLRRRVALKFMLREAEASSLARQRFTNEATILAQLHHPNVVEVYDSGVASGYRFFAMTHLPGGSLIRRRTEFRESAAAAVRVIAAVTRGVQHAHERGILHRDLKASNVLFDGDKPVVTDFGCAKWEEAELSTQGAALLGTPSHMAPEVWLRGSKEHDPCSDVWSLGVMLYQLLSGELPFPDDPRTEAGRNQLLDRDPPPVGQAAEAVPGVDERLEAVVRKVLAKAPAERYQSAADFADDLDRWLAGEPVSAATDPPTPAELLRPKPRKRVALAVAAAVTLALAGVAFAVSWWPKPDTPPTTPELPPVVKKSLAERLLKKGDRVEFIGEKGLPTERAGELDGVVGTARRMADGMCYAETGSVYLLELGNEELNFSYRVEGEIAVANVQIDTKVGLYSNRQAHPQPNGLVLHSAWVNSFGPMTREQAAPPFRGMDGWSTGPARMGLTKTTFLPVPEKWHPVAPDPQPVAELNPAVTYHRLTIDVLPAGWEGTRDIVKFPHPKFVTDRTLAAAQLLVPPPDASGTLNPPAFGNGFGLFVFQGGGQFRNVRIVRLD